MTDARDHPPVAAFAGRVRAEREARGWSLRDLAGKSGMDIGTLSRIENRLAAPSLFAAMRIADGLGLPLGGMLGGPPC